MKNNKRPSFKEFKEELLQDPEMKAAYDLLEPEFSLLRQFIRARKRAKYSQVELAEKLQVQQPAIARLERGGYANTSVNRLSQVADALGYKLKVTLSPKKQDAPKTKSKKV